MSRKRRHRGTPGSSPLPNADALQILAEEALHAARYKEAIEHYKELLKVERNPAWVANLAQAYAGRATQLAEKDMLKEALALWRTRSQICGTSLGQGPYLGWLVQSGDWEQVMGLLSSAESLSAELRAHTEIQLARVALVAPDAVLQKLPPDSPLVQHRAVALGALAAYAAGDHAAMNAHLSNIPFRSPYRDLRAILKAFALLHTDIAQAAAAIDRIPRDGPFEPMAAALRVCVLPGVQWLAALGKLDKETRALVLDIKGCPPEQRLVVSELSMLRDQPVALYDWLVRHRQQFQLSDATQLCLRLLPHVPDRLKTFRANFAPLAAAEHARILALSAELKGNPDQAEENWQDFINSTISEEPRQRAQSALVLNHVADSHNHSGKPGELCKHGIDLLAQSLDLDGQDRGTHLKLIRALRMDGTAPKELRNRIEKAVAQFPNDPEVLMEAVQSASDSGAHKKAVGLAKRILEIDPINSKVRGIIGQACLSQARKHLIAKKSDGAQRELEEAGRWLRTTSERGAIKLLQVFASEGADKEDALLREAVADLGGGLVGIFHLLLETARTKRNARTFIRRAGADFGATPSTAEVVALAYALNASSDHDKILSGALTPLQEMLIRATKLEFTQPEQVLVCEALHRRGERLLSRRYAEAALRRWPGRPIFVCLRAEAIYGDNRRRMPEREILALEDARDLAESQSDKRTASRLDALLPGTVGDFEMPGQRTGLPGFPGFPLPGGPATPAAAMEALLALGGEDALLEMMRKQLGKRMFEDLRLEIGGSNKQFARRLMEIFANPDALLGGDGVPDTRPMPPPKYVPAPRKPRRPAPGQKDFFDD